VLVKDLRPTSITLSSSLAGSRAGCELVRKLDSVMKFSLSRPNSITLSIYQACELVADLVFDMSQTGSSYLDMSR